MSTATVSVKFDREPLKYWQFMRLFSSVIDKETVPDQEKLTRLHQYTVGQARDAISHCTIIIPARVMQKL